MTQHRAVPLFRCENAARHVQAFKHELAWRWEELEQSGWLDDPFWRDYYHLKFAQMEEPVRSLWLASFGFDYRTAQCITV